MATPAQEASGRPPAANVQIRIPWAGTPKAEIEPFVPACINLVGLTGWPVTSLS